MLDIDIVKIAEKIEMITVERRYQKIGKGQIKTKKRKEKEKDCQLSEWIFTIITNLYHSASLNMFLIV